MDNLFRGNINNCTWIDFQRSFIQFNVLSSISNLENPFKLKKKFRTLIVTKNNNYRF
jgi:hypothetical protein